MHAGVTLRACRHAPCARCMRRKVQDSEGLQALPTSPPARRSSTLTAQVLYSGPARPGPAGMPISSHEGRARSSAAGCRHLLA
eukprot:CAMPEP_0172193162 /NCGR_PEP_ID=MMETSP1050-20130122/24787_1 /TAXON_ID=233186 /ORGANISM="Cryptomonas curvata, Strain CCAP979/52" /LENGTH=82 /DNA_ID=CAMNT_0012868659 /DNA_START=779 /DNA_END=1027 /DNA_ORIENTATION=-